MLEIQVRFSRFQNDLQQLAQKIGELEAEAEGGEAESTLGADMDVDDAVHQASIDKQSASNGTPPPSQPASTRKMRSAEGLLRSTVPPGEAMLAYPAISRLPQKLTGSIVYQRMGKEMS